MYVGLDLSPGRIKLVGVTGGSDAPRIVCAADGELPGDAEPSRFDPALVASQIASLFARFRVRPTRVALTLGPGDAVARRLVVVEQEPGQMLAALSLQLAQVLGGEVGTPRVGFVRLHGGAPAGRVAVFAGAARPDAVAAQQRAVAASGCEQGPVTTTAGALVTAWRSCRPSDAHPRVILLHVGETAAVWVLLDGDEPVALDAPLVGLASLRERARPGSGADSSRSLHLPEPLLAEWGGRLRQEIARGLQAARRDGRHQDPDGYSYEVWVSGGASRVPGFLETLQASVGAPVRAFDPGRLMEWEHEPADVFGPALVPALGGALQCRAEALDAGESPGLDLRMALDRGSVASPGRLPPAVILRTIAADGAFRLLGILVLIAIAAAVILHSRVSDAERGLAARESRVSIDSSIVATSMSQGRLLDARRQALGGRLEAVGALEQGRLVWPRVLAGIARAVPPTAWVSDVVTLDEDPGTGAVGYTVHGFAASDAVARAFASSLVASAAAQEARVERTVLVKIGRMPLVQFELRARSGQAPSIRGGGAP